MIKLTTVEESMTAGIGSNVYAYCIEVPVLYGATQSQPQISVIFANGTAYSTGSNTVIPCTATISMKYVNELGVVVRQQELEEHFSIGAAVGTVPTISLVGSGQQITYTKTKCCKSYGLRVDGILTLTTASA